MISSNLRSLVYISFLATTDHTHSPEPVTTASDASGNEAVLYPQGGQKQDGNTMVPVIAVSPWSVHGHGHGLHRYEEGRDEHSPLPSSPQPPPPQYQTHDNEHALPDDVSGEVATESSRDRDGGP